MWPLDLLADTGEADMNTHTHTHLLRIPLHSSLVIMTNLSAESIDWRQMNQVNTHVRAHINMHTHTHTFILFLNYPGLV